MGDMTNIKYRIEYSNQQPTQERRKVLLPKLENEEGKWKYLKRQEVVIECLTSVFRVS